MDIDIRPETPADAPAIEAVTIAAFLNAPHTGHNEQSIVSALRRAGQLTVSLVAVTRDVARDAFAADTIARDVVVGHVAISPVSISDGSSGWYGLGPISVLPDHQRQGVGAFLMREAIRRLHERGAAGCVVLGEPAYYGRFGFQADPAFVLADVPPEYFQVLKLRPSDARGMVVYHRAFAEA